MRAMGLIAVIAVVYLTTFTLADVSAETVDENLNKVSRSIARIKVVNDVCGERFVIDREALNEVMKRLIVAALKRFDEPVLSKRVSLMRLEFISDLRTNGILV